MNYFLAPRSGEKSHKNFQSTIKHGIPLELISSYLNPEEIKILSGEDVVYAWGNRAGTKSAWDSMQLGDTVIFYANRKLVMTGEVYFKKHSPSLALAMWPADENGNPWEYTFFLRNLKYISVPMRVFSAAAGFKWNFIVQGFIPLKEDRVEKIVQEYGSVEKMFSLFEDLNSDEIPLESEKVYVNLPQEIVPVVLEHVVIHPHEHKLAELESRAKRIKFKIDYLQRNKNNSIMGSKGEELVLDSERRRLVALNRLDLAEKVKRVSIDDDSLGYDILSFEENGSERYVEVKTSGGSNGFIKFFVTLNEYSIGKNRDDYYIYFVEKVDSKQPKITIFKSPIDESKFLIRPEGYIFEADR